MRLLIVAVVAMLFQQSLSYMAAMVLGVAAPKIAEDLGLPTALVGTYYSLLYGTAMINALMAGGFIGRFGALRMARITLIVMAVGLTLATVGQQWAFALGAVFLGLGSSISTPASSEILFKYATLKQAPLAFSIKQTGVPVGGLIAGTLVPFVIGLADWRMAFWVSAGICLIASFLLWPLQREFDGGQERRAMGSPFRDAWHDLRAMIRDRAVRELCLGFFTFVGVQICFAAFFVSYMVKSVHMSLVEAGTLFGVAQMVSVGARIFWGAIAGRYVSPRKVLGFLGVSMAVAAVGMGMIGVDWSVIAITAITCAYTATAVSYHGVMLAEVARLAPAGKVGAYTGGIVSFAGAGQSIYPAVFGILLAHTGSFSIGFFAAAAPALLSGIGFLVVRKHR